MKKIVVILPLIIVGVIAIGLGIAIAVYKINTQNMEDSKQTLMRPESLPEFAQKTSRVSEAYIFAVQNPDMVKYIACYCGCGNMQDSDVLMTHKSLKDCYIKSDGSYEPHAAECKLCNDISLQVRDMSMKGYSLKIIRKTIDDEYSGRGVGTNTSMPPDT